MISYKVQLIFQNEKEENDIKDFLFESTKVINRCFELLYHLKDKKISLKEAHQICYNKLKEEFPNLPVQTIIKSYKEVIGIYKSIKSNKHKIETYPVRKKIKLQLDKRLYSNFTINSIWLTNPKTPNKRIKVSFSALKNILLYKALFLGKEIVTVSPAFTSQDDCRNIERGVRQGRRYFTSDNKVFDSDWNAAINIQQRYKRTPFSVLPFDGTLKRQVVCQPANHSKSLLLTTSQAL